MPEVRIVAALFSSLTVWAYWGRAGRATLRGVGATRPRFAGSTIFYLSIA